MTDSWMFTRNFLENYPDQYSDRETERGRLTFSFLPQGENFRRNLIDFVPRQKQAAAIG